MLSYLQAIPTDTIIRTLIVSGLGLSIRFALTYSNQFWASTYHHTLTYVILPVIAMVVTKVIAGNIALALGMVGALSIVRFRNPVKNSFELVMYFALITIGIAATDKMIFPVGLGILINFDICSIIIFWRTIIWSLLVHEIHDNDEKIFIYKFASGKKEDIKKIGNELSNIDKSNIKNVQYSYTSWSIFRNKIIKWKKLYFSFL